VLFDNPLAGKRWPWSTPAQPRTAPNPPGEVARPVYGFGIPGVNAPGIPGVTCNAGAGGAGAGTGRPGISGASVGRASAGSPSVGKTGALQKPSGAMWSLQKFVEFITTMYSRHNPGGLGARCHRAVWTAPRTTKSADTGAAECEATAATTGLADNAVRAETTCLAMHMRAVDLGRVVAEATLREQSAATGPNAGIWADVGVS
jgi:hypothetical protein